MRLWLPALFLSLWVAFTLSLDDSFSPEPFLSSQIDGLLQSELKSRQTKVCSDPGGSVVRRIKSVSNAQRDAVRRLVCVLEQDAVRRAQEFAMAPLHVALLTSSVVEMAVSDPLLTA
ncbi:hypothetical protein NLJ89_g3939 [Agrocybe chaxingu]|uniref:Uncharacterized protein n=1 Tax=Agrocybe chaxingu TaxID=84603 RepID=A0A9W8K3U2_9AGAR|nr:hypothetical protein NLJ89_g3939 [Agrocybe chaxingu]